MNKEKVEIREIPIDDKVDRGEYSNLVKIHHSPVDFRFDFDRTLPDEGRMYIVSRIFMSPVHAKLFLKALKENIENFEKKFGKIEINIGEIALQQTADKSVH